MKVQLRANRSFEAGCIGELEEKRQHVAAAIYWQWISSFSLVWLLSDTESDTHKEDKRPFQLLWIRER